MTIKIRAAKKYDLEDITDLWYELATMHEDIMNGYDLSPNPKAEWMDIMRDSFDDDNFITFVAEENGEIIAFVSSILRRRASFFKVKNMGIIMDIFVRGDRRGEGIGTSLVEAAEDWIRRKGVRLAIVTVAPENNDANDFWNGHGYNTYLLRRRKEL